MILPIEPSVSPLWQPGRRTRIGGRRFGSMSLSTPTALAVAVTFVWLGMVLAISFVEAPLKFRAPGLTLPVGLGIGRLVFRALNAFEACFAVALVVLFLIEGTEGPGGPDGAAAYWLAAAVVVLVVQLVLIRPGLTRRTNTVLASSTPEDVPRSHAHLWYVGTEVVKVVALLVGGALLL